MTAWARADRTAASPSRLARSAPPLRGFGLDRLPAARRTPAKRSWSNMSAVAPLETESARGAPWRTNRPFRSRQHRAILTQCRNPTLRAVLASNMASCRTISTSSPVHGRGLDGQSSAMSRVGPSRTTGPNMCQSQMASSTYSRRGSATSLTSCWDRCAERTRRSPS